MKKSALSDLRLLISEDHASTRMGIRQILRDEWSGAVFGEAEDARATLALIEAQPWDLLILDISLPQRDGLDLLREVKRRWPALPALIYSAHPEDQFAAHALQAGASGYLNKERAPEELTAAVRTILADGQYLSQRPAGPPAKGTKAARAGLPNQALSRREFQVLRLIAAGKPGKAIAVELGLSQQTVSTYRARILTKLRLASVAELIQYAVHHRLI